MKKSISLFLAMLLLNLSFATATPAADISPEPAPQQQGGTVTNADVLMMLKMGLSSEVIIAKIKVSNCSFDTSPAALQELKNARASDALIMAMLQPASAAATKATTASQPNAATPAVEVKVPDGTQLELELVSNISSKEAQEGDIVNFTVVSPVIVNGVTIIERGAPAKARIAVAKKSGRWGKSGKLGWAMQDVLTVDGTRIPLRMEKNLSGDSKGGTVATGVILTSLVFWPAAPLWGFKKGKDVTIPAGKRLEAFVHGDVTVKGRQS
jgi:hypothetical protein